MWGPSPLKESWLVCAQTGAGQLWRRILEMHPVVAVLGLLGAFCGAARHASLGAADGAGACGRDGEYWLEAAVTVGPGGTDAGGGGGFAGGGTLRAHFASALRGAAGGGRRRWGRLAMQAVLLAVLVMGQRTAYMHIGNRGGFKLWMMAEPMQQMVQWLRDELPPESRVAIAGTATSGSTGEPPLICPS